MADTNPAGSKGHKSTTERAIDDIFKMNPRKVTVTLPLPLEGGKGSPTVTLEWTREDTHMPISDLLQRIEAYIREYGK
jgi:hypothetical protein